MKASKIVGLNSVKKEIVEIVEKKEFYRRCNISPTHMLFAGLGSGNGCSTISNWITDVFFENDIRPFTSLDLSLEFKPDGKTKENLDNVFSAIETASVYKNHYEGNIFINLDDVIPYANDSHVTDFIYGISEIGRYATLFFFIDTSKRNASTLINKIKSSIVDINIVDVEPYSIDDLVTITKQMIKDHGVTIDDDTNAIIGNLISIRNIKKAKECVHLKNEIIKHTNISSEILSLSAKDIKTKCVY